MNDAVQMFFQYTTALMKEMARLIRPGGRFVILTWNQRLPGELTAIDRALQDANFVIEASEEMTDWQGSQHTIYDRTIQAMGALVNEMGHAVAEALLSEARRASAQLSKTQRIFLVACRR
jgi:ubiquinone/menaquinone biosynthesis C-methylase UbiE